MQCHHTNTRTYDLRKGQLSLGDCESTLHTCKKAGADDGRRRRKCIAKRNCQHINEDGQGDGFDGGYERGGDESVGKKEVDMMTAGRAVVTTVMVVRM